jgi:hypothetical protein
VHRAAQLEGVLIVNRAKTALASVALVLTGGVASADLLVTKEGATVETQGAWRVDGRQVIFTLPNGTLSSIRTDEVDLDRSALATARAAEAASASAPAPAAAPAAATSLRLEESDLATVTEEGEVEIKPAEPTAEPQAPLQVLSWEQMPLEGEDGIQLFGTVRNNGTSHMTQVTVTAVLYGEEGGMLANGDATLNQTTIGPGQSANFRIEFPGLPDFASVRFTAAARGFEAQPVEGEEEEAPEIVPPAEEPPPAAEESAPEETPVEPPPAR